MGVGDWVEGRHFLGVGCMGEAERKWGLFISRMLWRYEGNDFVKDS